MISFGVTPALLMYNWSLYSLNKIGLFLLFIYTFAVAFRLARFNIQKHNKNKLFDIGLNAPASAGIIAGLVWNARFYMESNFIHTCTIIIALLLCTLLMVSKIKYYSYKRLKW